MERMKTIISEMSHLLSQITNEHKDYDGCVKKLKQIEDNVFYYYYYYKYHSSFSNSFSNFFSFLSSSSSYYYLYVYSIKDYVM